MAVFVFDKRNKPLMACFEKRARLLTRDRAVVHFRHPFTVCLQDRVGGDVQGINATYCKLLHRADGYGNAWRPPLPPPAEARGLQRGRLE